MIKALGYMRTSSATNVGGDKDSERRQQEAITGYAAANGYEVVGWYYDAAVKGSDPIDKRAGFAELLKRIASNGVRTIIVESPDRFARDLTVQLTGHKYLKNMDIDLICATAPDYFLDETPTAVLVRQILGAIAEFEKTSMVAKLAGARRRKKAATGRCEGRKPLSETAPDAVALARALHRKRKRKPSLRAISAELAANGFVNSKGGAYNAKSISSMLA